MHDDDKEIESLDCAFYSLFSRLSDDIFTYILQPLKWNEQREMEQEKKSSIPRS